jgi:hypothetical protein
MPRKPLLSPAERSSLMSPPATEEELASHYSFSERGFSLIRQRRGDANRLGFAVQLCLLRFPGRGLEAGMEVSDAVLQWVGVSSGSTPPAGRHMLPGHKHAGNIWWNSGPILNSLHSGSVTSGERGCFCAPSLCRRTRALCWLRKPWRNGGVST